MLAHHNADLLCRPVLVCALMSWDVCVYVIGLFTCAAAVVFSCFAWVHVRMVAGVPKCNVQCARVK
jgi:hypothetical protein